MGVVDGAMAVVWWEWLPCLMGGELVNLLGMSTIFILYQYYYPLAGCIFIVRVSE